MMLRTAHHPCRVRQIHDWKPVTNPIGPEHFDATREISPPEVDIMQAIFEDNRRRNTDRDPRLHDRH